MGLFKVSRSIAENQRSVVNVTVRPNIIMPKPDTPNPDPHNYEVLWTSSVGAYLVLEVRYPDATSYEGKKILLFENVQLGQLHKQGFIDPHFSDVTGVISPIARFEPTIKGRTMAVSLAGILTALGMIQWAADQRK